MIARVWRGKAGLDSADAYVKHLESRVFPELRGLEGFVDGKIMRRDGNDGVAFVVFTLWTSRDAIRAFAGDDIERAVVPPEAQALLSEWQNHVEHYEVLEPK